ncbi:hypothetical protein TSUD_144340 [Trifolium subterraneum]|uniref:Uncharacterized protein n=1 Tax=Trifolium subterraneum TaxID=3900 RepID=A0A2Z6N0C3_TRISU|nr:hypothetical protein TSUD_144340 [Trifolium subterraneum]
MGTGEYDVGETEVSEDVTSQTVVYCYEPHIEEPLGQMAQILGLGHQSDYLSYESENWQHADLDYETYQLLVKAKGESIFSSAMDMTLRYTKARLQPSIPEDLDSWRSKLLWTSSEIPMPLIAKLIINVVCDDSESPTSDASAENEEPLMLDFSSAMKVLVAKVLTSE